MRNEILNLPYRLCIARAASFHLVSTVYESHLCFRSWFLNDRELAGIDFIEIIIEILRPWVMTFSMKHIEESGGNFANTPRLLLYESHQIYMTLNQHLFFTELDGPTLVSCQFVTKNRISKTDSKKKKKNRTGIVQYSYRSEKVNFCRLRVIPPILIRRLRILSSSHSRRHDEWWINGKSDSMMCKLMDK